ncbi:helix-turn-helix transcriptional regulator [Arcanobacterium bovis]|uniref:WYL domain-containing protein n=1 Tax=Arcanobacterium bovis TaxID=2529275 RepID=A0A4Q9V2A6_9ACTO|nr:WYL domain-containing protein [Arcanobacterium bovis]TBW23775.1 hypothetical protein EZJ44_01160 [Arcanobacterium bovis]
MDLIDNIMARVVAAGAEGVKISALASEFNMRSHQIFMLFRPLPARTEITFTTNEQGEVTVAERDQRLSALNAMVLRDPDHFPSIYFAALNAEDGEDFEGDDAADHRESLRRLPHDDATKLDAEFADDLVIDRNTIVGNLELTFDELCGLYEYVASAGASGFIDPKQATNLGEKLFAAIPDYIRPWLKSPSGPLDSDQRRVRIIYKIIRTAMTEFRAVKIVYMSEDSRLTVRTIRPFRFIPTQTGILVYSHCYLRESLRHFRLDRIISAIVVEDAVVETE